jgi:DNA (cytosine-5)-methyltransferase 1
VARLEESGRGVKGDGASPSRRLTVVDLFCGAGGFSEGFRQQGFDIIYAADNWAQAVETFRANHPNARVVKVDLMHLSAEEVPRADVLIGGPPCTEFSGSNSGRNRDIESGMALVMRFLYFVHSLRPRWWVMENVPRLLDILPRRVSYKDLGIGQSGFFEIPRMSVFNAADFGAPQRRLRLFSGLYPDPVQTHAEVPTSSLEGIVYTQWISMGQILEGFPNPLGLPSAEKLVRDPLYRLALSENSLQDHFDRSCLLTREEAERNRLQKTEHRYYGTMGFPDDLTKPARTVMATQIKSSREEMVIPVQHNGANAYRRLTVRENASLQCYPLGYRFSGNSLQTKYKLVGNSVPVRLSAAVARAIQNQCGNHASDIASG